MEVRTVVNRLITELNRGIFVFGKPKGYTYRSPKTRTCASVFDVLPYNVSILMPWSGLNARPVHWPAGGTLSSLPLRNQSPFRLRRIFEMCMLVVVRQWCWRYFNAGRSMYYENIFQPCGFFLRSWNSFSQLRVAVQFYEDLYISSFQLR